jgi:hypothetical protein
MKGYKAFKKDLKGMYTDGMGNAPKLYWKKGDRKTIDSKPILCQTGYHFFTSLCFAIDYLEHSNIIYEVRAHGNIVQDTFKAATNDIEIVRRVTKKELKCIIDNKNNSGHHNSRHYNSGHYNSGYYNSGHHNSGDYNSGYYNSGHHNSGDYNSGHYNSGYYNSGNRNSGHHNSGYYNSGDYNSGNRNSGHHNSGNYNSGNHNSGNYNSGHHNSGDGYINYFCTKTRYFLFDVEINRIPPQLVNLDMSWFDLNNKSYKDAWSMCPQHVLNVLRTIPEFNIPTNKAKFKEITGIDL